MSRPRIARSAASRRGSPRRCSSFVIGPSCLTSGPSGCRAVAARTGRSHGGQEAAQTGLLRKRNELGDVCRPVTTPLCAGPTLAQLWSIPTSSENRPRSRNTTRAASGNVRPVGESPGLGDPGTGRRPAALVRSPPHTGRSAAVHRGPRLDSGAEVMRGPSASNLPVVGRVEGALADAPPRSR